MWVSWQLARGGEDGRAPARPAGVSEADHQSWLDFMEESTLARPGDDDFNYDGYHPDGYDYGGGGWD